MNINLDIENFKNKRFALMNIRNDSPLYKIRCGLAIPLLSAVFALIPTRFDAASGDEGIIRKNKNVDKRRGYPIKFACMQSLSHTCPFTSRYLLKSSNAVA
jgi:hypothetical protein